MEQPIDLTIPLTVKELDNGITEVCFNTMTLGVICTRIYADTGEVYGYLYAGSVFQSKEKAFDTLVTDVTNEFEKYLMRDLA